MSRTQRVGADPAPETPDVLVVDDMSRVRRAVTRLLSRLGRIRSAGCASEALDRLDEEAADVVLTDYDMPGDDGIALLTQVRARHPRTRRVLMSGSIPEQLEAHLASGLVEHFLPKPIDPIDLFDWLRRTPRRPPLD
jgi:CheY-like chemotaxis protein